MRTEVALNENCFISAYRYIKFKKDTVTLFQLDQRRQMLEHSFDYKIHRLTVVAFEHEFTMDGGMKNMQCM